MISLFKKKKQIHKTAFEKLKIQNKHENFFNDYQEIKSCSINKGEILEIHHHFENVDKHDAQVFLVEKSFNYYREHKDSFDEHFSYGNTFHSFIGKTLKSIKNNSTTSTKVVDVYSHSYGVF